MIPPDPCPVYYSAASCRRMLAHYDRTLQNWSVPYEERLINTRYGVTHVVTAGAPDLPPLLLFHGWGANAAMLHDAYNLPLLTHAFRVICPDTIGQSGRSAPTRPPTDTPAYGEWAADLLDGLGLSRVYTVGLGGGGYLALKLAATAPTRVTKVLVMSPAGLARPRPHWRVLLAGSLLLAQPSMWAAHQFVRANSAPGTAIAADAPLVRDLLLLATHYHFERPCPGPLSDTELRAITAPVHIMMGQYARTTRPRASFARADRLLAHVSTEVVPDAGHLMTLDQPGYIQDRLVAWAGD